MSTPTASTLLYLFGDLVSPPDKALTAGTHVPCKEGKVQKKPLSEALLVMSFLSLKDQGLIGLEVFEKKVLFVKSKRVRVTRLAAGDRGGLEGAIVQTLADDDTPKDVIYRWFRADVPDPWGVIVNAAAGEALALGYLRSVDAERGKVAGLVLGNTTTEPDCDKIAALEPEAQKVLARWQEFQNTEPDLYRELAEECRKGMSSRMEQQDRDFD